MNNSILKRAFIDALNEEETDAAHNFSPIFESKMRNLIRSQKGIYKLINTSSKRVACVFLIIVLSLTTVACSVKEIREPIIEEIKKICINAKEFLNGTTADEVSAFFPEDVSKIVATDYISETKKDYIIDDEEKIKEFITLISETYFKEPDKFAPTDKFFEYWTFDFYNSKAETEMQLKMCTDSHFGLSRIVIESDGKSKNYYIGDEMYRKILSFTNRELYLHDSALEKPNDDFCNAIRKNVTKGISQEELKKIKKTVRHAHYSTEVLLLENVSILKNSDSVYWKFLKDGNFYTDPITGEKNIFGIYDNYESSVYKGIISDIEYVSSKAQNGEIENNFNHILNLWKRSVKEHNIEGLFLVHEYLHDYDYFLYNYPTLYVYSDRADFQGTHDYFGHLYEALKEAN